MAIRMKKVSVAIGRAEDARRAKRDAAWSAFVEEAFPNEPFTEEELAAAQRELDGAGAAPGESGANPATGAPFRITFPAG